MNISRDTLEGTINSLLARLKVYDPLLFRLNEIASFPIWKKAMAVSFWIVKLLCGIVINNSLNVDFFLVESNHRKCSCILGCKSSLLLALGVFCKGYKRQGSQK